MPGVDVPMYGPDGEECGQQFITPLDCRNEMLRKGRNRSGSKAGLFLPDGKTPDDDVIVIVEEFKDAAAVLGLGFAGIGYPGPSLPERFAPMLTGKTVVLIPDLDKAGQDGARQTSARLVTVTKEVLVARLPGEVKPSKGDDVRDVLGREDGVRTVRDADRHFRNAGQTARCACRASRWFCGCSG